MYEWMCQATFVTRSDVCIGCALLCFYHERLYLLFTLPFISFFLFFSFSFISHFYMPLMSCLGRLFHAISQSWQRSPVALSLFQLRSGLGFLFLLHFHLDLRGSIFMILGCLCFPLLSMFGFTHVSCLSLVLAWFPFFVESALRDNECYVYSENQRIKILKQVIPSIYVVVYYA